MFTFTAHQMAAFDRQAAQREAARLAPIMRRHFDVHLRADTEAELVAAIERALNEAAKAGIAERSAITAFVMLTLLIGEGFHQQPDVARILGCGVARTVEAALVAMLAELQWQLSRQPEV